MKETNESSPSSSYDPPDHHRVSLEAIEKVCCELSLNQFCAFLGILVPSVDKIQHDHCYAFQPAANGSTNNITVDDAQCTVSGSDLPSYSLDQEFGILCSDAKTAKI